MKILIQMGNKGANIIDHLITPLAGVCAIDEIMMVTNKPGPPIEKVRYYYPPKFLRKVPIMAVIVESVLLLTLALFKKPQIITGYLLFPHGVLAYIVAKITRKPVIISLIAGSVELYSPGSPANYNPNDSLKLYGKCMLNILKNSNAIVTTGSITKDFLVKHGVPDDKVYSIINCPNKERFYPTGDNKVYDVIFVGRLAQVKNVETFLLSIKEAIQTKPKIKACIVGGGPFCGRLKEMSQNLGLENSVYFAGHKKDVPSYLNKSRIFILTSKREGFPNVYLEAVLCGLPSVVSNCGDIIDIAKDKRNALVISDCNDYRAFAAAILRLLADEEQYKQMKNNTIETATNLKPESNTHEWFDILNMTNNRK